MSANLHEIVTAAESILSRSGIGDYPGARNGIQVENDGRIRQLACAVDANPLTLIDAAAQRDTLLLVHHGLAWNGWSPLTGRTREMILAALEGNLAVFSSHLPLDADEDVGNNVLLAKLLDLGESVPCVDVMGAKLSRLIETEIPRAEVAERLRRAVGSARVIAGGPDICRRILVSSGSGKSLVDLCPGLGVDTLVTGEVVHDHFSQAHRHGLNIILGGHYATETLGVRALTEHLARQFNLPWRFLDYPSGL